MEKQYYVAYGSNLNVTQMKLRCPRAEIVGTAEIKDYELLFKGSQTGSYLTIEKKLGSTVPVAVWAVTKADEASLDRYEGYPNFYYKKEFTLPVKRSKASKAETMTAFAYIMHEEHPLGVPSQFYIRTCLAGYKYFGFDPQVLVEAYNKSKGGDDEDEE